MASSSIRKQCADDSGCKQTAVTNCEGCSKAFCIKHMIDHRRSLDEEMNVIIDEHDHLKNTLNQQTTQPNSHPFVKEINNWEKESVTKIQKRANELRQELLQSTTDHREDLSKRLQQLSEQLKRGREHDDFIETDLQLWKKTLDNLKNNLTSPATISINRGENILLVQNISVNSSVVTKEEFARVSDNAVRILEYGRVAVRGASTNCTEIRGKNEYMTGRHKIRLCIEQLTGQWIFFGINSKLAPLKLRSYGFESVCGWTSENGTWTHGEHAKNKSDPPIQLKTNDVITLIFDCDNCKISMINERKITKHELSVNVVHCPFPWQLHVVLFEPNSRVCIL